MKKFLRHLNNHLLTKKAFRFVLQDWQPAFDDLKSSSEVINTLRFTTQLKTLEVDAPSKGEFLVIAPHPDDEAIGPGGTILKAVQRGAKISILYLTSGADYEQQVREEEALKIAEKWGASVNFLRLKPKAIVCNDDLVGSIVEAINKHGKDGVFIPFMLDDHPDHKIVSALVYKGYIDKKLHKDIPIWAYQVYTSVLPNVVVDVTDVALQKRKLIDIFQSQYYARDWGHYTLGLNAYNCRYLKNRNDAPYAEIFLQLPLDAYSELCHQYFKGLA